MRRCGVGIGCGFSPISSQIGEVLALHGPPTVLLPITQRQSTDWHTRRFGPNYTILTRPNEHYEEAHSPRCRIRIWYQVRIACQALFTLFLTFFCERDLAGFLARQDIGQDIQGHGSDKEKGKQGKHPCNSPHHRIIGRIKSNPKLEADDRPTENHRNSSQDALKSLFHFFLFLKEDFFRDFSSAVSGSSFKTMSAASATVRLGNLCRTNLINAIAFENAFGSCSIISDRSQQFIAFCKLFSKHLQGFV